ncbi:type II toxin-antitoxin system PemK/MazF family toxin [Streptomyces sp. NPDC003395]
METSWWLALAAMVLLAVVAVLVDGWGRGRRAGRRAQWAGRGAGGALRPRPAEIWLAQVPHEDGPERRDRPCLVLSVHGRRVRVVKISTRYHDERSGVIPLPPGSVGDVQGRAGFLQTDELREVRMGDFRRRVGVVDPVLWDQVRHLAG